jgi:ArsR family transcriptional regulator
MVIDLESIRGGSYPAMDGVQFARIAKALADPRRLALMERIAAEPEVGCRLLMIGCPISQATVSHHIRELAEAGLVTVRREGKHAFFKAVPEEVDAYLAELHRRLSPRPGSIDPLTS